MRAITLALRMSLFVSVGCCLCIPTYANAQALCFWSDAQGELRNLSYMCGTNPDKKANNQSEIKLTPDDSSSTVNQQEVKPTVQRQQPDQNRRKTKIQLNFVPDDTPPIDVVGNEEKRGPDGTIYRGTGLITTPDGINIQLIFKDYEVVGEQIYGADGTALKPGETIISTAGKLYQQRKF
jgi:hypothetical protein